MQVHARHCLHLQDLKLVCAYALQPAVLAFMTLIQDTRGSLNSHSMMFMCIRRTCSPSVHRTAAAAGSQEWQRWASAAGTGAARQSGRVSQQRNRWRQQQRVDGGTCDARGSTGSGWLCATAHLGGHWRGAA